MHNLSARLELIANLVPNGAKVCDVGTDHGYLPIYLSISKKASSVIATDIRKSPLENAKKNIEKFGVSNISLRLCDGLSSILKGEADTVIIAGMGGEVIAKILSECEWIKDKSITLILQAMTSAEILRKYLYENGFEIKCEPTLEDSGRVYSVMLVKYVNIIKKHPEYFYSIGKIDIKSEGGRRYIEKQYDRFKSSAKALENISLKAQEYLLHKEIANKLEDILNGV